MSKRSAENADLSDGPLARKQSKMRTEIKAAAPKDNHTFNIWYHKYTGDGDDDFRHKAAEERLSRLAQLDVERDCGVTRGSRILGRRPFVCLHFARGECDAGAECNFLHRIPSTEDEKALDTFHDVFGREKHREDKDDMSGVGSFNREGRTLYIGGLHTSRARKMEKILQAYFGSFGELEYVRVIYERSIAFVRFVRRTSAEFAKEAAHERPLLVGHQRKEMLNVRWAHDDPNPVAKEHDHNVKVDLYNAMMFKWWANLPPEQQAYYQYQEYLNQLQSNSSSAAGHTTFYPNTADQFSKSESSGDVDGMLNEWLLKYLEYLKKCGGDVNQEVYVAAQEWLKKSTAYLQWSGLLPTTDSQQVQQEQQQQEQVQQQQQQQALAYQMATQGQQPSADQWGASAFAPSNETQQKTNFDVVAGSTQCSVSNSTIFAPMSSTSISFGSILSSGDPNATTEEKDEEKKMERGKGEVLGEKEKEKEEEEGEGVGGLDLLGGYSDEDIDDAHLRGREEEEDDEDLD